MFKPSIFIVFVFIILSLNNCIIIDKVEAKKVYHFVDSIFVGGKFRTFILNLPSKYYETPNVPLVLAMHGVAGSAPTTEQYFLINEKADEQNYAIIYPEGVVSTAINKNRTWNAGTCCEFAAKNDINDVGFISALIDSMPKAFKINKKKIYATGMSNGGMLSYRLACELSNKIAAIAAVSGPMVVKQTCNPARAMPILHIHSVKDKIIPYLGGQVDLGLIPSVSTTLTAWSKINDCKEIAKVTQETDILKVTQWTNCNQNTEIIFYLTKDGGHIWPGSNVPPGLLSDVPSRAINANQLIFEFFNKFQLP
jgi:polyhydroxybutyrate depolymerase